MSNATPFNMSLEQAIRDHIEHYDHLQGWIENTAMQVISLRNTHEMTNFDGFEIGHDEIVTVNYCFDGYSGDNRGDEETYIEFPLSYLWDDDSVRKERAQILADNMEAVAKKGKEDKEKKEWATEQRRRSYYELKKEFG